MENSVPPNKIIKKTNPTYTQDPIQQQGHIRKQGGYMAYKFEEGGVIVLRNFTNTLKQKPHKWNMQYKKKKR